MCWGFYRKGAKSMKDIFLYCKNYLTIYKGYILLYIIIGLISSASGLISPYIIGNFIDHLGYAEDMGFILNYFILFGIINIISLILGYIGARLYTIIQSRLGYELNKKFIKHMQHVPLNYLKSQDMAYLNQQINGDANQLIMFCINTLHSIIINIIIMTVALILLFSFNPLISIILLVMTILYTIIYLFYRKILYAVSYEYKEIQSNFFSKLYEQLINVRFIKIYSLFKDFISKLDNSFTKLLKSALRYQHTSYIFSGLDKIVVLIAQLTLLFIGGREIINNRLSIGHFVIISSYFNMILGSIRYFFSLGQSIQGTLVSKDRLEKLAVINIEPNGKETLEHINNIKVENLKFNYSEKNIIKDMNITFEKGHIYFIVGPNGIGKTTLIDILMGLHSNEYEGKIMYNDISIKDLDMYTIRQKLIGIFDQRPVLIKDTLRYNLNPIHQEMILEEHKEFNHLANLLEIDKYITDKLDTIINDNMSGGEMHKIALIRALINDNDLLILDEPTSTLDAKSTLSLMNYLHTIKHKKIIIVITHDNSYIDNTNDIIIDLKINSN